MWRRWSRWGLTTPRCWSGLRTPGQSLLTSSITRESADLLALAAGLEVLVLSKATAVRIGRGEVEDAPGQCVLHGRIERLARGQGRDEVVLSLDGGGQWVGFAEHPFAARKGTVGLGHHGVQRAGGGAGRLTRGPALAAWFI